MARVAIGSRVLVGQRVERQARAVAEARAARLAPLVGLTTVALALRLFVLVQSARLGADEAVEGLMARHILTSGDLPVFYWGQAYFGAAEAYLVAGLFAVCGVHWWLVFVPALVASTALVPLTWAVAERLGPWPAAPFAALAVAVPTPVLSRMLDNAGGGFSLGFALEFGALVVALHERLALSALLAGLAMWVWQPAVLGLAPLLGLALCRRRPRSLAPLLIGLAPLLIYNATSGWPTPAWLAAKFGTQDPGPMGPLLLTAFGGGDESIGGANRAQALLVATAWIIQPAIAFLVTRERQVATGLVLLVAGLTAVASHAGARHLLPATLAGFALTGALLGVLSQRGRSGLLLSLATGGLVFGVGNLVQYADVPSIMAPETLSSVSDTQAAIAALDERGLRTGYADYWTAYPVMYLSDERIVVAPALPLAWGPGVDRHPAYTDQVDSVAEPSRVFLLVDDSCAIDPYLSPLDRTGTGYRVDEVARWRLVWDVSLPEGAEMLRTAVAAQPTCS